jgi:hypothetical protein
VRWLPLVCLALACQLPPEVGPGLDAAGGTDASLDGTPNGADAGVSDARAEARADAAPPSETVLHVRVHDAVTGAPLPAKLFLRDEATGQEIHFGNHADPPRCEAMSISLRELGTGGALATWNGIALWRGEARIPIGETHTIPGNGCAPEHMETLGFGRYLITAGRGLEYELTTASVDLGPKRGEVFLDLPLNRVIDTRGYLAADMHIHSGKGDGTGSWDSLVAPADRIKTEVVAGIEVMVSSDHDYVTDFASPLAALYPEGAPAASITGDEISANFGHFGAMPMAVDPGDRAGNGALPRHEVMGMSPQRLFDRLHAMPSAPLVQLNHPRLSFAAYFNDTMSCDWRDTTRLPKCSLGFDAIEILNGWLACTAIVHQTLDDWHAMMRFGIVTTATGNSDTHGSSMIEAGFPRTYVRVGDDAVSAFDEDVFMGALRQQRAIATTGPFLTLRVGDRAEGDWVTKPLGPLQVSVRMQAASWVKVDTVRLLVDGAVVRTWEVPRVAGVPAPVFEGTETLTIAQDAAITAEAEGVTPLPVWMTGDFQLLPDIISLCRNPAQPGMIPFAATNAVIVDADGDGKLRAGMAKPRAAAVNDVWVPPHPGPDDCNPLEDRARPPASKPPYSK